MKDIHFDVKACGKKTDNYWGWSADQIDVFQINPLIYRSEHAEEHHPLDLYIPQP